MLGIWNKWFRVEVHQSEKRNSLSTSKTLSSEQVVDAIVRVLANDDRVVFAYLYGSMVSEGKGNDVDLAVFPESQADSYSLAVDLYQELFV